MNERYCFSSCFAPYIRNLIAEKNNAGYQYESAAWILQRFDRFCIDENISEPVITRELAKKWGTLQGKEDKKTLTGRISVLRQLSLYMQAYGINSYVPSHFSAKNRHIAYVLNSEEITALFLEIDSYIPGVNAEVFQRLAMEYKVLFRLILCCGLRVSEARKLRLDMVDLENGILTIHQSKGNRDRLVYMPEDLCMLCRKYLEILYSRYRLSSDLLFPASDPDKELQVASIGKRFHQAWEKTPYAGKNVLQPTVHSLRHTFVVMRMNEWMKSGLKMDTMMPYLSKYLGHTSPDETFYYYHQVEEAFSIIRQKDTSESFVIPEVSDEE